MFDSLIGYQVLSVARDVPLGLINPEHLISALRWLDSTTDNQHPDSGHLPDETPTKGEVALVTAL